MTKYLFKKKFFTAYATKLFLYFLLFITWLCIFNVSLFALSLLFNICYYWFFCPNFESFVFFDFGVFCQILPDGDFSDTAPKPDPSLFKNVPQGYGPVAAALMTYRTLNNMGMRGRVLASLGAAGVTGGGIALHTVLNDPEGFGKLMWGYTIFRKTGIWGEVSHKTPSEVKAFEDEASTLR